jgi:hypothetical protein
MNRYRLHMRTRSREGQYDVRVGASVYAPIISVFGSLAVPTVIVVLQDDVFTNNVAYEELALALLIVGILGSLSSGFGFAAIAAERDPTANLIPGVMYLAVPASVGLGSVFAAFGVVAHLHLPDVSLLFSILLGLLGCFGVFFTASTVMDAAGVGPRNRTNDNVNSAWLAEQWISNRDKAPAKALPLMIVGFAVIAVGLAVRISTQWFIEPSYTWTIVTVSLLGVISLLAIGLTSHRTIHRERQVGLRLQEAYLPTLAIALFIVFLLFVVP